MAAGSHVLRDEAAVATVTRRLRRAQGQVGAVVRMLEEGRSCEDVVTQLAAASKALQTAAFTIVASGLRECLEDGDDPDQVTRRLQKVFLSLA